VHDAEIVYISSVELENPEVNGNTGIPTAVLFVVSPLCCWSVSRRVSNPERIRPSILPVHAHIIITNMRDGEMHTVGNGVDSEPGVARRELVQVWAV
jgi:hypothetical protein